MAEMAGIEYRRAGVVDAFSLMKLHQVAVSDVFQDPLLLDYKQLCREIESPLSIWVVAERDKQVYAALSILLDSEHGIAKVNRFLVDPKWHDSDLLLKGAVPLFIRYLGGKGIEVVYTTTHTVPLVQQELTLELGFRVLGIFPAVSGSEPWKVIGLTGFFFDGVLGSRRYTDFALHPKVHPIFEITRRQCSLASLPVGDVPDVDVSGFEPLPPLEFLYAPSFVSQHYRRLRERGFLSVNFYPFHEPNALITDPEERIEIFIRMMPESRSAAIIGERLDRPVNPAELYDRLALMVNRRGISFVEVINDAADIVGIDLICRAGYIPCAYFPSFKRQGEGRRDYVVMARSFEHLSDTGSGYRLINPVYLEYLAEYYRQDVELQAERMKC